MGKKTILSILTILLAATLGGSAAADTQWLHVAVDGEDSERVRVNVPLSLVAAILPLIDEEGFHHGRVVLDGEEFDRADLVAMLTAVAEAEDGEYVSIDDEEDHVRVAKKGDAFLIHVEERHRQTDEIETRVNVRIPVAVINALATGDEDELNIVAAVEALGEHGSDGDLVTVIEDDETVRIWIDRKNVSD